MESFFSGALSFLGVFKSFWDKVPYSLQIAAVILITAIPSCTVGRFQGRRAGVLRYIEKQERLERFSPNKVDTSEEVSTPVAGE